MSERAEFVRQAIAGIGSKGSVREKAAHEAAERVLDRLTEDIINKSVLEEAREIQRKLVEAVGDANDALLPPSESAHTGDKAREVINLATALVTSFVRESTTTGTATRKKVRDAFGDMSSSSHSVESAVSREAIRATSYIVWAYLKAGDDFPKSEGQLETGEKA